MENPFEDLRPVLRSEEDEIRKGVFSQALRNFHQASLEERRSWCKAIRESTARSGARAKKTISAAAAGESLDKTRPPVLISSSPYGAPGSSTASASPPAQSSQTCAVPMQDTDVAVGQKRSRGDSSLSSPDATMRQLNGTPNDTPAFSAPHASQTATEASAEGLQSTVLPALKPADEGQPIGADAADALEEETEGSVKECVASYMRSLLDRVVGTGIDSLAVPALKILCMMLGIQTGVSNKMGLYSILADFYFSKCAKLGKRVSRDTVSQRHLEQDVAMLKQVASASASSARSEKKSVTSVPERAAQAGGKLLPAAPRGTTKVEAKREAIVERKKSLLVPIPKPSRTAKTVLPPSQPHPASEHYPATESASEDDAGVGAPESSDDYDGDIIYEQPVLTRSSKQKVVSSDMSKYEGCGAGDDENGSWSLPLLERKVASIVQLYDPVTVAIVVKKLSQMGYRESGAEMLVEHILRRFHDRQLIFYDNGIAYLM